MERRDSVNVHDEDGASYSDGVESVPFVASACMRMGVRGTCVTNNFHSAIRLRSSIGDGIGEILNMPAKCEASDLYVSARRRQFFYVQDPSTTAYLSWCEVRGKGESLATCFAEGADIEAG